MDDEETVEPMLWRQDSVPEDHGNLIRGVSVTYLTHIRAC